MFNWICPECGREVPPSATECRFCAEQKKAAASAVDPAPAQSAGPRPPQPPPPQTLPPPQPEAPYRPDLQSFPAPAPQQQYYAPPPGQPYPPPGALPQYYPPPPGQPPYYQQQLYAPAKRSLPTWALAILFGLAFIGVLAAVFFGYQYFGHGPRAERAGVTEPAATARSKTANPLQKYVEIVGIRLVGDAKHKPQAKFIVVNHSNAELDDLTANVTVWASTSRSEEDSVGTFSFKLPSIAANESKELTEPLNTKLKIYELPDWQNITAEIQLAQP